MIERLNDYDQQRVLGVVKSAAKDVASGANPNNALVKHASTARLGQELVKRACESFNVSKTLAHLAENDGEKRAEAFAIADPISVISQMWPDKVASTVNIESDASSFDLSFYKKQASDNKPKLQRDNIVLDEVSPESVDKAFDKIKAACDRRVQELHIESTSHYNKIELGIQKVANHFGALYAPDFEKFSEWAFTEFGADEVDTLRIVGDALPEKRASLTVGTSTELKEDYTELHGRIKVAGAMLYAYKVFKQASNSLTEKMAEANKLPVDVSSLGSLINSPIFRNPARMALSGQNSPTLDRGRIKNINYNPYDDPLMQDVSQTRTMLDSALSLHNAMTEDEVLSKADPKVVLSNYNDIFASAPDLVRHPALLKSTLRHATEYGQLDSSAMQGLLDTYNKADGTRQKDIIKGLSDSQGEKATTQLDQLGTYKKELEEKHEAARAARKDTSGTESETSIDKLKKRELELKVRKMEQDDQKGEGKPTPTTGKTDK